MSGLQPGDGYGFSASSSGITIDVNKPWTPPQEMGLLIGFSLPKFPDPPDPPDVPVIPGIDVPPMTLARNPLQFASYVTTIPGAENPIVQVAIGSVTYTHSNMPFIKQAPFADNFQAQINFAAVLSGSVTAVEGADATSPWMLSGGGYALTGEGRWYVTLTKWDTGNEAFEGGLLDQNLPWVSFVKEGEDEFDAIFVDGGPSLYSNTMNVHRMTGYDAASTGLPTDWGNCHTTWFNPRFFGNHTRILSVIDSIPAVPSTASVIVIREGGPTAGNEIQQIAFVGIYKSGSVTFSYSGHTTTSSFNPNEQGAFDLQSCLETISALSGNVFVQACGPGLFQVEFSNVLRNTDVAEITINSSLTSWDRWYRVFQQSVGSQDIVIPCQLNSTELMNKLDVTEAEDPYNINAATTPAWNNVVNLEDATNVNALGFVPGWAEPVINDSVPRTVTKRILDYGKVAGCTDDAGFGSDHPFLVKHVETIDGNSSYKVVSGTVNSVVPNNMSATISLATAAYYVFIKVPVGSGTPGAFPDGPNVEWDIAASLPADTDTEGYILLANVNGATVTQYVTGSVWADRIKLGTQTAKYYWSGI